MPQGWNEVSWAVPLAEVAILSTGLYFAPKWFNFPTYQLKHIPTVGGSSSAIWSYLSALRFYFRGHAIIQEGYEKHYGSAFKVSTMSGWRVILTGPQMIEDVRRAPDKYMTLHEALPEIFQTPYTIGPTILSDPFHIPFTKAPLARRLANSYMDLKDEIAMTIDHALQMKENGRNTEYLQLGNEFLVNTFVSSQLLNMLPQSLQPLAGRIVTRICSKTIRRAVSITRPLVEEYVEQKTISESVDKTGGLDLIEWLVDEVQKSQRALDFEDLTKRVLDINFAASGNTIAVLTDMLFNLASYPEYVSPMRDEVKAIVEMEGWTKASIAKMHKIESFVKETLRVGTGNATGNRKIIKDFTFSDGTSLPAGTYITFATHAIHHDANNYPNPTEFQAFRFVEGTQDESAEQKNQAVNSTPDFLIFGTGRHACPGRFYATFVLKYTLAHIVLNYDVEYPKGCARPKQTWFQAVVIPDASAELVFRKRK